MSAKYDDARDEFAEALMSWTRDRFVAQLVSREYIFSATHRVAADLKGQVGEPVELTGRRVSKGWLRAASPTFKELNGPEVVALVIHRKALDGKRATLVAYLDQVERFPMKPNGGDLILDLPEQGILRL